MVNTTGSLIISASTLVLSLIGSVFVSGVARGRTETRLAMLEANQRNMATKEQLAGVKEDLAEIKGMFRMTLREEKTLWPCPKMLKPYGVT